ncbi:MAG: hypothetical protein EZS26_000996 [Candidatus Ordinivivax streblomastigis]|uniref:Uncharacterized protein n=1 Tax=Candidatus Ordinivivax streblomastigis TaxID=2540710 RepID=A0A5M8P3C7_9BACT|nr:MAG: hypothetical protein EZS26_000996 [Candidatus Ordinivivax streblomastigis]
MDRRLLEELHEYFSKIANPTDSEKHFLIQLTGELPFFPISSVSRDDLKGEGFVVSKVTDGDMETIASKMGDDYCDQLYWDSLRIIADCVGVSSKDQLIEEIKEIVADYGAFNTADVEADASPCIHSGNGVTVLAEFFLENGVTATTYNEKGMEIHNEFKPYTDLEDDVLQDIYDLCLTWKTIND